MSFSRVLSVKNVGLCALLLSSSFVQADKAKVEGSIFADVEAACIIEHMVGEAGGLVTSKNVQEVNKKTEVWHTNELNPTMSEVNVLDPEGKYWNTPGGEEQLARVEGISIFRARAVVRESKPQVGDKDTLRAKEDTGGGTVALNLHMGDLNAVSLALGMPVNRVKQAMDELVTDDDVEVTTKTYLDGTAATNDLHTWFDDVGDKNAFGIALANANPGGRGWKVWRYEYFFNTFKQKCVEQRAEIDAGLNGKGVNEIQAALGGEDALDTAVTGKSKWVRKLFLEDWTSHRKANAQAELFDQVEALSGADAAKALSTKVELAAAITEKGALKRWMVADIDEKAAWVGDKGRKAREHAGKAFAAYLRRGPANINAARDLADLTTQFNHGKAENEKLAEWQIEMLVKCYPGRDKMKFDNCKDIYNVVKAVRDALHTGNQTKIGKTGPYVPAMNKKANPSFADVQAEIQAGMAGAGGSAVTPLTVAYITFAALPTALPAAMNLGKAFKDKRIALAYFMVENGLTY